MKQTYTYRIRLSGDNRVRVEKEDPSGNPRGEISGVFRFSGQRKARLKQLSHDAYQNKITSKDMASLGVELFKALFEDRLEDDFLRDYHEIVENKQSLLRLELEIDENQLVEVAALPWEFLRTPPNQFTGELWLATTPEIIFSRYRARALPAPSIKIKQGERLRIALVVSTPLDEDLQKVSYEKLWQELVELAKENPDQIELLEMATPATQDVIDSILRKKPHIVHFIGHGRLHDENNKQVGQIALQMESEYAIWVDGLEFATLFDRWKPGIVLLQACEGGALSASEAFAGVASQIVQRNISVVVAMQYEISNAIARRFAREFYTRLAAGDPVDKAAQEGRFRIAYFYKSRNFATPVLFMRVRDGHLFEWETLPQSAPVAPVQPAPASRPPDPERRPTAPTLDKLRLDTALPETVFAGQIVHFAVAIRQPDSAPLSTAELAADGGETAVAPVTPGSLRFDLQINHDSYSAFDSEGPAKQTIMVQPGGDPPIVTFRLRPRRPTLMNMHPSIRPAGAHLARFQLQIDLGDKRVFDETFETRFSDQPPYAAPLRLRSNLFPSDKAESLFLTAQLRERLDANSLYELCAAVDTHPENLPGDARPAKARELIGYCTRTAKLPILQKKCQELWPDDHWYLLAAEVAKAG
jgi:hypothetical protein